MTERVSPSPPPPLTRDPARVGGYDLLMPLASGGLGRVYLARRRGQVIAMKRAHPHLLVSPTVRASFLAEDAALRSLEHPHVVRGIGLVDAGGELAVLLEYVHGVSLAYLLDRAHQLGESIPPAIVGRIGQDLSAALSATHARGLAHADVNPRNVLVGVDGVTKLCDFGLACAESTALVPSMRGTLAYAAPETLRSGAIDRRSDVFSAAATLWEAYRVERLFRGASDPETLRNIVERPARALDENRPELSALAAVLSPALARDPGERTPTAALLGERLGERPTATRAEVAELVVAWARAELERRELAMRASS